MLRNRVVCIFPIVLVVVMMTAFYKLIFELFYLNIITVIIIVYIIVIIIIIMIMIIIIISIINISIIIIIVIIIIIIIIIITMTFSIRCPRHCVKEEVRRMTFLIV